MSHSGGMSIPLRILQTKPQRGFKVDHLLSNRRWMDGPEFLRKAEEEWPASSLDQDGIATDDPEVKRELTANAVIAEDAPCGTHQLMTYFSDWKRLKR